MLKKLLNKLTHNKYRQIPQRTLKNIIKATGTGLHSGKKVYITLRPASENTGIIFHRIDLPGEPAVPALLQYMGKHRQFTSLEKNGIKITSVEHILSALMGMGIDNACIDLTEEEMPAMDGSAGSYIFLLQSAEVVKQAAAKKFIRIKQSILVEQGESWVRLEPYDGLKFELSLDFECSDSRHVFQKTAIDFSQASYIREVCRARNFILYHQLAQQQENNLSLGVTQYNTILISEDKILGDVGYRYENELARHKVLDAMGDLKLLQNPMLGAFSGNNNHHQLNKLLMMKLLADKTAWEIITL